MNISIKKTLMVSCLSICLTIILSEGLYRTPVNILENTEAEAMVWAMESKDKAYGTQVDIDAGNEILSRVEEVYIEDSNFNIKYEETRKETIEPITKIVQKEDMYMGDILKEEGSVGYKEVVASVNYTNGVKTGEEIVTERTLIDSKDTVLYKGIKCPIEDKVAFLQYPTEGGTITSYFGQRWGRMHNGIDIGNNEGEPVYSSLEGVVKECHYENGYGNKIVVEHDNNITTVYAHLSELKTNIGAEVKKGDLIGKVGNTGNSTGPHLHFEVRVNGVPINPQGYIRI